MKILYLTKDSPDSLGGVADHIHHIAQEMNKKGHEVYIVCTTIKSEEDLIPIKNSTGVTIIKYKPLFERISFFGIFTILDGGISLKVIRIVKSIKPDVMHIHRASDGFLLLAGIFCKWLRYTKKIVYTPHSYSDNHFAAFMVFNRCLIRLVDKVYAVTNNEKYFLINYFKLDDGNIFVCYNGVSQAYLELVPNDARYILYVGDFRRKQNKGLVEFLKAFDLFANTNSTARAIVIGRDTNAKQFFSLLSPEHQLRIEFLGGQPRENMEDYFRSCSFFVMPSYKETFGIVYIQAMACAKAVVGCKIPCIDEIIEDSINGYLVDVGNVGQLVAAMNKLWNNPELCAQLGRAGKEKVRRMFTWTKVANDLEMDYKNLF